MQGKIRTKEDFLERTDLIAAELGISLRSLAPKIGISIASLFGYRSGNIPISAKAWKKLENAEDELLEKGQRATWHVEKGSEKEKGQRATWHAENEEPAAKLENLDARLSRVESLLEELVDHLTARREGGSSVDRGEEKAG